MTTEQPISITRGEDVTLSGTVTDQDGAAVDISGDSMVFTIKNSLTDADADAVKQINATNLGADGTFDVPIADTDTKNIDLRPRWYDLEITHSTGTKATVSRGRFTLKPDVTKA